MAAPCSEPWRASAAGVSVAVRLRPAGGADRVDGLGRAADGAARIEARVAAAPEDGKANKALIKLLAKAWHLPAGAIALVSGARARDKVLRIAGPPEATLAALRAWAARLPQA